MATSHGTLNRGYDVSEVWSLTLQSIIVRGPKRRYSKEPTIRNRRPATVFARMRS